VRRSYALVAAALAGACSIFTDFDGLSGAVGSPPDASPTPVAPDAAPSPDDVVLPPYVTEVLADRPLAYYRLDEETGPARDAVGGDAGTYTGPVARNVAGAVDGGGGAMRLPRAGSAGVLLADRFDFADNVPFTIELWMFVDAVDTGYQQLINKVDRGVGWKIQIQRNNGAAFLVDRDGASRVLVSANVEPRAWVHYVVAFDGVTVFLYRNAALADSSVQATRILDTAVGVGIGRSASGSDVLGGVIDEVAFYDRVLPPARVLAHYRAAF